MDGFWEWLSDPANRETLGWLGGGAVVVIGGIWTAYLTLRRKPKAEPAPERPSVAASGGGVAIGGDATKAKIKTGKR